MLHIFFKVNTDGLRVEAYINDPNQIRELVDDNNALPRPHYIPKEYKLNGMTLYMSWSDLRWPGILNVFVQNKVTFFVRV